MGFGKWVRETSWSNLFLLLFILAIVFAIILVPIEDKRSKETCNRLHEKGFVVNVERSLIYSYCYVYMKDGSKMGSWGFERDYTPFLIEPLRWK